MKTITIYFVLLSIILSCNSKIEKTANIETPIQHEIDEKNNKKGFTNRSKELIAIREHLKEKLPNIVIDRFPAQIEKLQFALIADGYNISLEETAKKSLHYKNQYQRYMSIFIDEKFTYNDVVKALSNYKKFEQKRKNKSDEIRKLNVLVNLQNKLVNQVKECRKNGFLTDEENSFMTVNQYLKDLHPNKEIKYSNLKFENNYTAIFADIYDGDNNIYSYIFSYRLDINEFTFDEKGLPDVIYDGD
jgi:hypothetical protein